MGNQNTGIQTAVSQTGYNMNAPYYPQMNVDANNQYAANVNQSAQNEIPNPQNSSQLAQQIPNQQQQQMSPYNAGLPIQQGIPVIQGLEIAQVPQQPITDDLKDQPFQIKKSQIIKALIIYLFMQFFSFVIQSMMLSFTDSTEFQDVSLPICIICFIGYFLVLISAKFQKYQQNPKAILNSFLIVMLQSLTLISYCSYGISLNDNTESQNIIAIYAVLVIQYLANCFVIIVTITYLYIEKNHIKISQYILMLVSVEIVFLFVHDQFQYFFFPGILYGLIIILVISQIMDGRFQLKKNQTFGICNAIYLGFMIPCNIF